MRRATLYFIALAVVPVAGLIADTNQLRDVAQNPAAAGSDADATKTGKASAVGKAKLKSKAVPGLTPEREAAAKTFVEQHHPELAQLLLHLKANNPKEYEKAVRDLFRTSERLALAHERDVERYEIELQAWQVQSKIDLLTARYRMTPTPELKSQLQRAVAEQVDLRKTLLALERQRAHERFEKIDEQLKVLEKSRDEAVERQLRSLLGTSEPTPTSKPTEKTTEKPTVANAATNNTKPNAAPKTIPPNPTSKPSDRAEPPATRSKDKTSK